MAEQALNESSPAQYSRFVQRLHRRYENWFDALPPGAGAGRMFGKGLGLLLALAIVAAGTCGDLIESLVKRDVGIKDMSSFLPGHGGAMDRLDSVLVASPVAWLILYLLIPN